MNCSYFLNESLYPAYLYPNQDSNITTTLPDVYIAEAAVLSVVFPLSFIGMVLNIVFIIICRKITIFLQRGIVYLTVITTLYIGALWFSSIPGFKRDYSISWYQFCIDGAILYMSAITSSLWMMSILFCSICFSLVTQLYGHSCCFSRRPRSNENYCLEFMLDNVMITLLIGLVFGVFTHKIVTSISLIIDTDLDLAATYFFLLPVAIVMISVIGNTSLICVWRYLWRRKITERRAAAALVQKEIKFIKLVLFLIGYFVSHLWFPALGKTIIATPISLFPLLVSGFLYYYSFRNRTRADIETVSPGLPTAPPSTRVSLPTDTAEHAPNSLSPSTNEPSEVTPLMT